MKKYTQILNNLISFLIFIFLWEGVSIFLDNEYLFPDIMDILKALVNILMSKDFLINTLTTLGNLSYALIIAGALAVVLGSISSVFKVVRMLINPYINMIRSVPTIAIIIIILIWAEAEVVPIVVGSLIVFPLLYDNIYNAIHDIPRDYLRLSQVFEISMYKKIKDIYFPYVLRSIRGNLPSLIGLTLKVVIAGEVLAQNDKSIGGAIFLGKMYLESSDIFAWVIIIVLINYLINLVLTKDKKNAA